MLAVLVLIVIVYDCNYLDFKFFFPWIVDDDNVEMIKVIVNEKENENEVVNDMIADYYGDDYYYDDD